MKNTLAENLLRFGVKNLSEADKKNLQEQTAAKDGDLNLIMNQVASILNKQIDAKIAADPNFPQTKLTVERKAAADNIWYNWKYGNITIKGANDSLIDYRTLMASNGPKLIGDSIKGAFNINTNRTLPKTLQTLPQPGLAKTVDKWVAGFSPNPIAPGQ
jgi:hypothetical protein